MNISRAVLLRRRRPAGHTRARALCARRVLVCARTARRPLPAARDHSAGAETNSAGRTQLSSRAGRPAARRCARPPASGGETRAGGARAKSWLAPPIHQRRQFFIAMAGAAVGFVGGEPLEARRLAERWRRVQLIKLAPLCRELAAVASLSAGQQAHKSRRAARRLKFCLPCAKPIRVIVRGASISDGRRCHCCSRRRRRPRPIQSRRCLGAAVACADDDDDDYDAAPAPGDAPPTCGIGRGCLFCVARASPFARPPPVSCSLLSAPTTLSLGGHGDDSLAANETRRDASRRRAFAAPIHLAPPPPTARRTEASANVSQLRRTDTTSTTTKSASSRRLAFRCRRLSFGAPLARLASRRRRRRRGRTRGNSRGSSAQATAAATNQSMSIAALRAGRYTHSNTSWHGERARDTHTHTERERQRRQVR